MGFRDLRLGECTNAFQGHGQLPKLKTRGLRRVGKAYERNIRRVYSFVFFPPAAITASLAAAAIGARVAIEMEGQDEKKIAAATSRELRMFAINRHRVLAKGDATTKALMAHELETAFKQMSTTAFAAPDGAEAWLAAQVTATWTAFEAMAEDLWEAALNAKPKGLADLPGRKQSAKEERRILLRWLYANNYNLSHLMGTILKEEQYKFDRLSEIRRAYTDAFPEYARKVHAALADKALDVISLVRNVLVHNGGIVDKEYLLRSSDLPQEARGSLNAPIFLDGPLVAKIVGPVMKIGNELVVAVDQWLDTH